LKDKTLLNTDYLIDDNDWNFKNTNVKHAILIDAPYNKDITISDVFVSGNNLMSAKRCTSLLDFYDYYHLGVMNNGR
jgi:5'(3')-deoxyribonucleotidase